MTGNSSLITVRYEEAPNRHKNMKNKKSNNKPAHMKMGLLKLNYGDHQLL